MVSKIFVCRSSRTSILGFKTSIFGDRGLQKFQIYCPNIDVLMPNIDVVAIFFL
ncbi:hypothetical protein Tsubulata_002974 [Turnera subulata]|uniref:Uncharacterized protein n=1 Tax=Turnera subulata TaxID=218843 RepID=A0A9Q0GFP1_9ROSI|nr:hypothetical protein Tsubulata_002974 [Turnera subulata]